MRFAKCIHPCSAQNTPHLKAQGVSFSTGLARASLVILSVPGARILSTLRSPNCPGQPPRQDVSNPFYPTCHGLGFSQSKHEALQEPPTIAVGPNCSCGHLPILSRLTVIPNGVNTTYYVPPWQPLTDQVVYIARMDGKIPPCPACPHPRNCFRRHLTVVADWNPEVPGTIFQSWQADIRPTLQQAGIVAASGRTAREALACGNAVLLIQRGYDGLITPALSGKPDFDFSGNHSRFPFSRLRRDLSRLFSCPPALERLQVWSRRYAVENLSSAQMAQKVLEVYDEAKRLPSKGR